MDGDSSWRARSEVLQYVENSGIFRHVIGHAAALANIAVFLQQDDTIAVFDHDSEGGGPSGIDRFASSVEPSEVFPALGREEGGGRAEMGGG